MSLTCSFIKYACLVIKTNVNINVVSLQHCIENLNIQIDAFECEIENLMARKKKLDRDVSILCSLHFAMS